MPTYTTAMFHAALAATASLTLVEGRNNLSRTPPSARLQLLQLGSCAAFASESLSLTLTLDHVFPPRLVSEA